MVKFYSPEARSQQDFEARRLRDQLVAAGLPIAADGSDPYVQHAGVQVEVRPVDDDRVPIVVRWRPGTVLREAARTAVNDLRPDKQDDWSRADPQSTAHTSRILRVMQRAIIDILVSAGYSARESTDAYDPFGVDILEHRPAKPVWWAASIGE